MKYTVTTGSVHHDGKIYPTGSTIELAEVSERLKEYLTLAGNQQVSGAEKTEQKLKPTEGEKK